MFPGCPKIHRVWSGNDTIIKQINRYWTRQGNAIVNEIDDYLYDEIKGNRGIVLSLDQMDNIIERTMLLARHRMPS